MERMGNGRGGGWIRGKEILLLDLWLLDVCKICVGPFQTTVWVIPQDAKVQKKAGKFF